MNLLLSTFFIAILRKISLLTTCRKKYSVEIIKQSFKRQESAVCQKTLEIRTINWVSAEGRLIYIIKYTQSFL